MDASAAGRVRGKIAIVTGAASGLGAAITARLIEEGAVVIATDVDTERGESLAAECGARFAAQDVRDERGWHRVIGIAAELGGLDVLVNNAGIADYDAPGGPEHTTLERWREIQAINGEGVFLGCKHAIPAMRARGGGSIVNISSIAALVGTPFITAYGASKAAVRQLTMSVALHCASQGWRIRCNSVHPGQIRTPMLGAMFEKLAGASGQPADAIAAEFRLRIPLGEFGEPADIANAVLFLASDEARYVTGAQLLVDGGMHIT